MTYTGRVQNGVVVFDGNSKPRDGAVVRIVEVLESSGDVGEAFDQLAGKAIGLSPDHAKSHDAHRRAQQFQTVGGSIWDDLRELIGTAQGLPEDMAEHHDHYIRGANKRKDR